MNGNTTGGGSNTGSNNTNTNNNNNIYDYSFVNPNTQQYPQPPSIATTTTTTTTTMNHNTHHSQQLHSVFAPQPSTTTTVNPYHRYTTTANPQQQQHGPSTASYDPTIHSTATASNSNNTNNNQLYMAYINASFNHPSQPPPQLSPRSRPATTPHQQQHHHSYLNHPYHTSGTVATLSPILTATTTPSLLDNQLGNRDLSPIPLHGDDNNNNNDNLNINIHYPNTSNNTMLPQSQLRPNNNNRRIRARSNIHNYHNKNNDIIDTTTIDTATAQQQLDHLLFGGGDLLLLGNDHLLEDPNLLLFPSAAAGPIPASTTTATATSQHRRSQQQMYFQQPHSSSSLQIEAYLTMKASFQPQQSSNTTTTSSLFSDNSAGAMPLRGVYNQTTTATKGKSPTSSDHTLSLLHTKIVHEPWMDEIQLNVSSISLTPISGYEIIQRIQCKLQDVVYKYIPCVDFLVNCQQDLRRGIETMTTQKRYEKQHGSRSNHTNSKQLLREIQYGNQFYMAYISDLSSKFYNQTKVKMIQFRGSSSYGETTDTDVNEFLSEAMKGLASLQQDAHRILTEQQQHVRTSTSSSTAAAAALIQNGCCEAIKSAYLGGMKDGESWGLRKWLSKHGNALHVCTDLECILNACQKLPRGNHTTRLLAKQLRQMTKPILQCLQKEIPPSYQKHSSAHPYLPFFHRLESALRSMSNFDPDDDDVICLDDDDDDDNNSDKDNNQSNSNNKVSNNGDCADDEDDVIEVDPIHMKPTAKLTNNSSKNKKRSAVDATSTSSDNNNSPDDDDDEEDMDVTERKRSNIHGRSISTTNGYHHIANDGNMNYKNDNKYEMLDDDIQSSSGESEVQSIVEIIDIIGNSSTDPTMTMATTRTANGQSGHTNSNTHGDWQCSNCFLSNAGSDTTCLVCGEETSLKDLLNFSRMEDFFDNENNNTTTSDDENENNRVSRTGGMSGTNESSVATATTSMRSLHHRQQVPLWPVPIDEPEVKRSVALVIANNLEKIATMFDQDQQASIRTIHIPDGSFWDGEHYGSALRLFAQIIRSPESYHFLECVDDDQLHQAGNNPLFSHVIKHPLSLRQIARSLLGDEIQQWSSNDHQNSNHLNGEDGYLKVRGLSKWNMWIGKDLLQAIDLVFLNSLAYGNALNQGRSQHRSSTNQLRKKFWNGITEILNNIDLESRKQSMPTRRAEKSGFVVYKIGES